MKKFTSQEIKEFVSKPLFDEKVILKKDPSYPKISIITPSYNQAKFLERTILSVLNQNYPNLEFIIIDGGSTDSSLDIIKKYDKYLTYWVSEKDKGQSDAINKGFQLATGEIIAWQNSDDIYLPNIFKKISKKFEAYRKVDIIFGNIFLIDDQGNIVKEMRFIPFSVTHLIYYDWNLSSQGVFWKRKIFNKTGFLDKSKIVLFDLEWFIRLGKVGMKFKFIREFIGCYRIHEASKFSTISFNLRKKIHISILQKYGILFKNEISIKKQFKTKRMLILLRRISYYLLQRDFNYLYKGIRRRIQKK